MIILDNSQNFLVKFSRYVYAGQLCLHRGYAIQQRVCLHPPARKNFLR